MRLLQLDRQAQDREDPADHELFAFLTTEPDAIVDPVHKKAMPVILTRKKSTCG